MLRIYIRNRFWVWCVRLAQEATSRSPKDDYLSAKDIGENPLKRADTSSPRDTLQSFLAELDILIDDLQPDGQVTSAAGYRAYQRAISTLDFSTTPNGNARMIMTERLLLLQEILARIELPRNSEIPGDDEVAHEFVAHGSSPRS